MKCKYDEQCRFKLCQFKHSKKFIEETEQEDEDKSISVNSNYENDDSDPNESIEDESDDDTLTDNETTDFEWPNEADLKRNEYNDCGGCRKVFDTNNSYKCQKCSVVSHRSNCNTWFDHLKKHYFCGCCAHDFKYKKTGKNEESEISESEMSHV